MIQTEPPETETRDQHLFKALLDIDQPIAKTCRELEKAAMKYGKNKRFPPPQIQDMAGLKQGRSTNKYIKKWYYAIAIDVLYQHGINLLTLLSPEKLADYWISQHKNLYSLQEAQTIFIERFKIPKNKHVAISIVLEKAYMQKKITDSG